MANPFDQFDQIQKDTSAIQGSPARQPAPLITNANSLTPAAVASGDSPLSHPVAPVAAVAAVAPAPVAKPNFFDQFDKAPLPAAPVAAPKPAALPTYQTGEQALDTLKSAVGGAKDVGGEVLAAAPGAAGTTTHGIGDLIDAIPQKLSESLRTVSPRLGSAIDWLSDKIDEAQLGARSQQLTLAKQHAADGVATPVEQQMLAAQSAGPEMHATPDSLSDELRAAGDYLNRGAEALRPEEKDRNIAIKTVGGVASLLQLGAAGKLAPFLMGAMGSGEAGQEADTHDVTGQDRSDAVLESFALNSTLGKAQLGAAFRDLPPGVQQTLLQHFKAMGLSGIENLVLGRAMDTSQRAVTKANIDSTQDLVRPADSEDVANVAAGALVRGAHLAGSPEAQVQPKVVPTEEAPKQAAPEPQEPPKAAAQPQQPTAPPAPGAFKSVDAEPELDTPIYKSEQASVTEARGGKPVTAMSDQEKTDRLYTDGPTGLKSRQWFEDQQTGKQVLLADMDGLKSVNDTYGHEAGDALIKAGADAFQQAQAQVPDAPEVARWGGDEFAAHGNGDAESLTALAEKANEIMGARTFEFVHPDGSIHQERGFGFSYGIAPPGEGEHVLKQADAALQQHKLARRAAGARVRAPEVPAPDAQPAAAGDEGVSAGSGSEAPVPGPEEEVSQSPVETAAADAATHPDNETQAPTEAQIGAGNYAKGHVRLNGLDISIENPKGTSRRPEWPPLTAHYGYIRGTEGNDGDHVDTFLGPKAEDPNTPVYVVDQIHPDTGRFDEHKVLMGYGSEAEAREAYQSNYKPGWKGLGGITEMSQDAFKAWLKRGDTKKPLTKLPRNLPLKRAVQKIVPRYIPKGEGMGTPETHEYVRRHGEYEFRDGTKFTGQESADSYAKQLEAGEGGTWEAKEVAPGRWRAVRIDQPVETEPEVSASRDVAERRSQPREPMTTEAVHRVLDEASKNQRFEPSVIVRHDPHEVFPHAPDDVAGAYHKGQVYLFAKNLHSPEHAKFVLVHELVHRGISQMDPSVRQAMLGIYRSNPELRAMAQMWMRDNKSLDAGRATEEAMADLVGFTKGGHAEHMDSPELKAAVAKFEGLDKLNGWQRLVAAVRDFARRAFKGMEFSTNDIRAMLEEALDHGQNTPGEPRFTTPRFARRVMRTSYRSDNDYIVPETPEYAGNTSGDLAEMPKDATRAGIEQLPIRLHVGRAPDVHQGYGILHLAHGADLDARREPPAKTDDRAENFAQHVAHLARNFTEVYRDGRDRFLLRSPKAREALVVQQRTGRDGSDYYSVISMVPARDAGKYGRPIWTGRSHLEVKPPSAAVVHGARPDEGRTPGAAAPVNATREGGAPARPPGQEPSQPGRVAHGGQTEHFTLPRAEDDGQEPQFSRSKQQVAPTFYSQMERDLEAKLPGSGTPESMLQQVEARSRNGGFKQEELDWSGVREWLKEQKGKVSRDQVLEYLRDNNIQVRDVTPTAQYERYQIPGGSDYHELLLTLAHRTDAGAEAALDAFKQKMIAKYPDARRWNSSKWVEQITVDEDNERDRLEDAVLRNKENAFSSGHFEEPNVLAHVRFNSRTDADGKKVLHVEEVQSDWHQQGRRKGYSKPLNDSERLELQKLSAKHSDDMTDVEKARGLELLDRDGLKDAVPDAPFKTTWPMLAMKRMIRYAAENGYDRITWTTGDQQAERYDISKQIDSVEVVPITDAITDEKSRVVYLHMPDGHKIQLGVDNDGVVDNAPRETAYKGKSLADVIGKELADKVMGTEGRAILSGNDLKVGGAGMRAFYDKMLPNEVNKYVKKWGSKVDETKIMPGTGDAEDIDKPWMVRAYYTDGAYRYEHRYKTEREAKKEAKDEDNWDTKVTHEPLDGIKVHSLDITPAMRDSVTQEGQPLFSRNKPPSAALGTVAGKPGNSPELDSALEKAGIHEKPQLVERVRDYLSQGSDVIKQDLEAARNRIIEGVFDRYHGIKSAQEKARGLLPAEQDAYVAARLSTGTPTVLTSLLVHGHLHWKDGILQVQDGTKGLLDTLKPVRDDINAWMGWMVGNRAKRLIGEGRENLFKPDEIDALIKLGDGKEALFKSVRAEYAALKTSVLKVAADAGLLDEDSMKAWDHADHIPFYRLGDQEKVAAPGGRRGLSHQNSGIRQLKGGTAALNDPLENILMNFTHLLDASLKNHAVRMVESNLHDTGLLEKLGPEYAQALVPMSQVKKMLADAGMDTKNVPPEVLTGVRKMLAFKAPSEPDVIRVMDKGKASYYRVHDAPLLRSLTAFNEKSMGGVMEPLRFFKRLLTSASTVSPGFMARVWVRDSLTANVISKHRFPMVWGSARGLYRSLTETGGQVDLMAAGASFHGGNVSAHDPQQNARVVRRMLRRKGFDAASADHFVSTIVDSPARAWEMWRRGSEAVENSNREAVYEAALKSGAGKAEAAYNAKDLLDYSMRGNFAAVKFFTDSIPFLNARLQGLYKIGRAGAIPGIAERGFKAKVAAKGVMSLATQVALRGAIISAASLALYAYNRNDKRYQQLPDWDKDTYWHIFMGDQHFRIPKPFEVGLIFGTMPERWARLVDGDDTLRKSFDDWVWNVGQVLNMDPVPQVFKPVLDVHANKDSFTGSPIETESDESVLPADRYDSRTSPTMVALGRHTSDATGYSPKQMQELYSGYTGALGMFVLSMVDDGVRLMQNAPPQATARIDEMPPMASFIRGSGPAKQTQWENDFYSARQEINETYESIKRDMGVAQATGDTVAEDRAKELLNSNTGNLGMRDGLNEVAKELNGIRQRIDAVQNDRVMSPDEKRVELDKLYQYRDDLMEKTYGLLPRDLK